jgi:hypothetical protein
VGNQCQIKGPFTMKKTVLTCFLISINIILSSCQLFFPPKGTTQDNLYLPYLKNTENECYYLDDFMPTPNNLVSGKAGSLSLRYYSYNSATYKEWQNKQIVLTFYSKDDHCWSLFEEYYIAD